MGEFINTNVSITQAGKSQILKSTVDNKQENRGMTASSAHKKNYDSATIDVGWKDKAEMEAAIGQLLDDLRKQYPKVEIWVDDAGFYEKDFLEQAMGNGIILVISDEFMNALKNGSKDDFEKKSEILTNILKRLSAQGKQGVTVGAYVEENKAIFWKASDKKDPSNILAQHQQQADINKYLEKKDSNKNDFKIKVNPASYNVASIYAKLAHARSKSAVQQVVQQAHRHISAIQLASVYGDDKQRMQARAALRSYNKLLLRGNRKIRQLSEVSLTEIKRKRAMEQQEEKKAEHLKEELRRKRTSGKIRDGALVKEGQLEELQIPGYDGSKSKYSKEYDDLYTPYIPEMPISGATDILPGGIDAGSGAGIDFAVVSVEQF